MKKVIITTIWIIIPLTASAIFFDDFDGDDFSSNWKPYYGQPPYWESSWEYHFENSWVVATNIWGGFSSGSGILVGSSFGTQDGKGLNLSDFEASAKVRWQDGQVNSVGFTLGTVWPYNSDIGISYVAKYPIEPVILVNFHNWGGGIVQVPAPPPGEHVLELKREGTLLSAYVNGNLIYSANDLYSRTINGTSLYFGGPLEKDDPMFKPVAVDWINVVPEPVSVLSMAFGLFVLLRSRKNKRF